MTEEDGKRYSGGEQESSQAPSLGAAIGSGERPRLRWMRELWGSTLGKKLIVAVTGVILAGYVIAHAAGNLKALQGNGGGGEEAPIDKYSEFLRTVGDPVLPEDGLLWLVRVILLAAFVIHIVGIAQLVVRNRAARSESAAVVQRSWAARTMAVTGTVLLAFVVFHVLHLTTRTIEPTTLAEGAVYSNLYGAFQEWWLVAIYVGAVVLLMFHLHHGLWSVMQTHGFDKPNRNPTFRRGAMLTAVGVTVAFALVPLAFAFGWLPEPSGAEVAQEGVSR